MSAIRLIASWFVFASLAVLPAFADSFYIKPHIQNVAPDAVTIMWQTQVNGRGEVEYGPAGTLDQKASGAPDEMIRKVRITGLRPDTEYSYRVTAGNEVYTNTFKTAPAPDPDREVTFVILGDTRRWEDLVETTRMWEHVLQWDPEFFIINGDLVGSGHQYAQWPGHFKRFSALNGRYMVISARGNHEGSMINDVENDWFAKYHDIPEPYTFFDWGNVHVVLLSWEQTTVPAMVSQTAEWLDQHLAGVQNRWTFVSQHFPIYCTGYDSATDSRKQPGENTLYLRRVLDKHNVSAHMSGHTHIYERLYPLRDHKRDDRNGVHYLVNGGDINANYAEWFTAFSDHSTRLTKPTYTVYQCKKDRMDIRTFAWSPEQSAFAKIDRDIVWKDEAVPAALLASLPQQQGEARLEAVEQLGAMLYAPAADTLAAYVKESEPALRQAAAKALAMIGNEQTAEALFPYLGDADPEVRWCAARAQEVAMPDRFAKHIAEAALSPANDEQVRVKLVGALQEHANPALAKKTVLAILKSDAPAEVRQRAAYALTRVAEKKDARTLARLFNDEKDAYVTIRLAFTLNQLTGVQQPIEGRSPLPQSEPGKRKEFVDKWLAKK